MQNGCDRSIATSTKWFRNEALSLSLSLSPPFLLYSSTYSFLIFSRPFSLLSLSLSLSLTCSLTSPHLLDLFVFLSPCQSRYLVRSPALFDRPTSGSRPRSILAEITSSVGSVVLRKSDSACNRMPRRRKLRRDALPRARKRKPVRGGEVDALFSVNEPRCNLEIIIRRILVKKFNFFYNNSVILHAIFSNVMRLNGNYILHWNLLLLHVHSSKADSSFWCKIHFVMTVYLYRVENYIGFDLSVILTSPIELEPERRRNLITSFFLKCYSSSLAVCRLRGPSAMSIIHV